MEYFDFEQAANVPVSEDSYRPCIASESDFNPCVISSDHCFEDLDFFSENPDLFSQPAHVSKAEADLNVLVDSNDFSPANLSSALCPSIGAPLDSADCDMTEPFDNFPKWIPGWIIPPVPCDNCRAKQLECMVIYKGQNACTSCITLFKECSFVGAVADSDMNDAGGPRGIDTLHGVSEEAAVANGSATGCRLLRSTQHMGNSSGSLEKKARKTGTRFSRDAVRVLKDWLVQHASHPYPTDDEKDHLKKQTGLKRSQISNWLANARRRGKVQPQRSHSPGIGVHRGIAIPPPVNPAQLKEMGPLERWKNSPPEHEPASVTAIADAVACSTPPLCKDTSPYSGSWAEGNRDSSAGSSFSVFRAPSMTSVETGGSSGSDMSFSSLFSHQSRRSFGSASKDRRRRRRQPTLPQPSKPSEARQYQCTFCTDTFKTKYDWARHERSLHLSLERWICAPGGGIVPATDGDGNQIMQCVYCHCTNPAPNHLDTHNFAQCSEKTLADRTFYRKDHLRQHLRLTHACTFLDSMEVWKTAPPELRSRCGFCDASFSTWQERVDHIAKHYKEGKTMRAWKGDWGFDRSVLQTLESAMPPWLISQERDSFVPMSAEKTLSRDCQGPVCDCYEKLERGLTRYMKEQLAKGIVPTDKDLQQQGRLAVYDFEDGWNQTAADNPEWLRRFKILHGVIDTDLKIHDSLADELHYCSFELGKSNVEPKV